MKNPIKIFKEIFTIKDEPKVIAKGFALGSFIGMLAASQKKDTATLTVTTKKWRLYNLN